MVMHEVSPSETEMHDVQLLKSDSGLGITVAGYVCDEEEISGIFVRDISSGSVADLTGNIKINDRIVKVNGRSVTTLTNQEAIELLKKSGPVVIISVERYLRGSKYDRLQHGVRSTTLQSAASPKYFMSTLPNESGKPSQKEKVQLNLLAETTEEDEKLNASDLSPDKEKAADDHSSDDTSAAEFKIETDFVKNTVTETPLNSSVSTLINKRDFDVHNGSAIDQTSKSSFLDVRSTVSEPLLPHNNCRGNTSNKLNMIEKETDKSPQLVIKGDNSVNSDSSCIFFSKSSDDTERDGYETCVDESFSEDIFAKNQLPITSCDEIQFEAISPTNNNIAEPAIPRTLTPSPHDEHFHCVFLDTSVSATSSEPCLNSQNKNYLQPDVRLNWKSNENNNLKSYDSPSGVAEADEFFLVQCIDDNISVNELNKCVSEPNVPESYEVQNKVTYKCLKLEEYYNDYKDCLEEYRTMGRLLDEELSRANATEYDTSTEMDCTYTIEDDSNRTLPQTILPFKSSSVPHILDYFDEVESCQTPRENRAFSIPLYHDNVWNSKNTTMTVASQQQQSLEKKASESVLAKHWGYTKTIEVYRQPNEGIGITIVCGKVDLHTLEETSLGTTSGIFVKSIVPNSAAGKTEKFHPGDKILNVNGIDLSNAGQEEALAAIQSAGDPISFVVQSLLPLDELCIYSEVPPATKPSEIENQEPADASLNEKVIIQEEQTSDVKEQLKQSDVRQHVQEEVKVKKEEEEEDEEEEDEEEEDTRLLGGRTITKQGKEIDRSSAGNIRRSKEEIAADLQKEDEYGYTNDKIRKRYAQLGSTIMMVQLERGQEGLGLSLAGHKDRNCMAVFVCGLNPNGVAYKAGEIQVGDEILEVNGVVLHGRCHLNASAIIKGLAGPIFKIVLLRRKAAVEDIAVRPLTHFPVTLIDEISEDKFSNYPNVRNVAIKKGSHSLGIMIIEGKHSELGQGIFISDIQDGSAAEKAGLEVGEMILAVNKNSLLGANYDTAATLLKRTEGVVTLILSNPAKKPTVPISKNSENEHKPAPTLKVSGPPSRATTPLPEPAVDPTTCSIIPGRNNTIEMITDNRGLGLFLIGGKDTLISNGIIVVEVFPDGAADKDGRIKAGDHILDANGVCLKEATHETATQTLRQILPKMRLVILRPEKIEYTTVEVDLTKKPGKGLGLSIIGRNSGKGVYISEILNGGNADIDGRILKGDMLVSVNGQNTEDLSADEVGALLKTVTGRTLLKFHRYKPTVR